jgi:hypothetical protein
LALPQVETSANGAEYDSPRQARSASPWIRITKEHRGLKGRNNARYYALSGLVQLIAAYQGRRASRFAPGYHISAPLALKQSWTNYYFPV